MYLFIILFKEPYPASDLDPVSYDFDILHSHYSYRCPWDYAEEMKDKAEKAKVPEEELELLRKLIATVKRPGR